jgi:predicted TIM-barrel enzyme
MIAERTPGHRNGFRGQSESRRNTRIHTESPFGNKDIVRFHTDPGGQRDGIGRHVVGPERAGVDNRPNFRELFGNVNHPLIGMHHLPQLPGYDGREVQKAEIESLKREAVANVRVLAEAGFNAVMVENNGDSPRPHPDARMPEWPKKVYTEVMRAVAQEARRHDMRVGVHIGYDPETAIEVAHAEGVEADFLRIDVFADDMRPEKGSPLHDTIICAQGAQLVERNRELERENGRNVFLMAGVQEKHFEMVNPRKGFTNSVADTLDARPDAIIITGGSTGQGPDLLDIRDATELTQLKASEWGDSENDVPILIGSGVSVGNVREFLDTFRAYGAIVGTSIQKTGSKEIDLNEARFLSDTVRSF